MRTRILVAFFLLALVFENCKSDKKNCSLQHVDANKKVYRIEVCLNGKSLEDGEWYVYDTANTLIEHGHYENGLRDGRWYYPTTSDTALVWGRYKNVKIGIETNMLSSFTVVETDDLSYVKFSNKDSGNLINFVFTIHDLPDSSVLAKDYSRQGEQEITEKGWKYDHNNTEVSLEGGMKAYFNEYKVYTNGNYPDKEFYISNVYAATTENKLAEITCRYPEKGGLLARKIFVAVVSNYFINGRRFINPFAEVKAISAK